jgi:hypothetical protein
MPREQLVVYVVYVVYVVSVVSVVVKIGLTSID